MKRLLGVLLLLGAVAVIGCKPAETEGAEPPAQIPEGTTSVPADVPETVEGAVTPLVVEPPSSAPALVRTRTFRRSCTLFGCQSCQTPAPEVCSPPVCEPKATCQPRVCQPRACQPIRRVFRHWGWYGGCCF